MFSSLLKTDKILLYVLFLGLNSFFTDALYLKFCVDRNYSTTQQYLLFSSLMHGNLSNSFKNPVSC